MIEKAFMRQIHDEKTFIDFAKLISHSRRKQKVESSNKVQNTSIFHKSHLWTIRLIFRSNRKKNNEPYP